MIGQLEQYHMMSDYYLKVKSLNKKTGCVLYTPKCIMMGVAEPNKRTYSYKDGTLTVKDEYKKRTVKIDIPHKGMVRPLICLDILRQCQIYNMSSSLIILYDKNDKMLLSQDFSECIQLDLTSEEINREEALFEELESIIHRDFSSDESIGQKVLKDCIINGGLV